MKKFNCLILFKVLFVLCFFSCSKDQSGDQSVNLQRAEITPVVKQLLASSNVTFNAISFGDLMNDNERYSYVYNKISQTISLLDLNKAQITLANELLENLTPEIYSTSPQKDYFVKTFIPKWIEKAKANFTFYEIKMIFGSYRSPNNIKEILTPIQPKTKAGTRAESTSCDANEYYSTCGVEGTVDNPDPMPGTGCTAGCFCQPGYLRAYPGGPCINPTEEAGGDGTYCNCKASNSVATLCGGLWNANEYCKKTSCKTFRFCGIAFAETCNGRCLPN